MSKRELHKSVWQPVWFGVVAFLLAVPLALWAQLPALPLEEGNFWEFDYVLGEDRSPGALRLQVGAQVRIQVVLTDTVFSEKAGWNALFNRTGDSYFKLSINGRLPLFGPQSPDTLLVRADDRGNIWIHGYTFNGRDNTVVKGVDQLWLTSDIGAPYYRVLETSAVNAGGRMAYHTQMKWLGVSDDGKTHESVQYTQRFPDDSVESKTAAFPARIVAHASRFQPGFSAASPYLLLAFEGTSETVSESCFSFFLMTGVGFIWIPIWSDQTELQGAYYELTRALVGGQLATANTETMIQSKSWASLKSQEK